MANNQSRPPRRGPMGPGMGPGVGEKAKDFKSAVKRLVKELGKFKILIIIALILAIVGAVLSISAPDRLSKLTDEILAGIIPKMENGQIIMPEINMDAIKSIAISLVYIGIRYHSLGIIKQVGKTILAILVVEALILSIYLIFNLPIDLSVVPTTLIGLGIALLYTTSTNNELLEQKKAKEEEEEENK